MARTGCVFEGKFKGGKIYDGEGRWQGNDGQQRVGIFEEAVFVRVLGLPTVKTNFHEGEDNWYEGEFQFGLQGQQCKADSN